ICLIQLLVLVFNPMRRLPTPQDAAAGWDLVRRIASFDGDVFVPCHGYLAAMAGKPVYTHLMGVVDLDGDPVQAEDLHREIRASFEQRRFSAVIPCSGFLGILNDDG